MTSPTWLEFFQQVVKARTPGRWWHDDGQFAVDSDELKKHKEINSPDPKYDRLEACWTSFPAQYGCECGEFNSDKDAEFFTLLGTVADELVELVLAAQNPDLRIAPDIYSGKGMDEFDTAVNALDQRLEALAKKIDDYRGGGE